jgi:hypothetical protein
LTLSFDVKLRYGLLPGHRYGFVMEEFDVPEKYWGYGSADDVLSRLRMGLTGDQRASERVLKVRVQTQQDAAMRVRSIEG